MAKLIFDGTFGVLTLIGPDHKIVDSWPANNVTDHRAKITFIPDGHYLFLDRDKPNRHGKELDSTDGTYGPFGDLRLAPFSAEGQVQKGIAVHSGRRKSGGPDHPTKGCIRTTDEAMKAICEHIAHDPLQALIVRRNHNHRWRQQRHYTLPSQKQVADASPFPS